MSNVRVITDSSADLPADVAAALGVDMVSLTIRFGEQEFTDRVDLSPDDFWARCKASKVLPETAAPSPGAFQRVYEAARDEGCDGAIVLTLSAALSATHQSATLAADTVPGFPVRVVDTQAVSMAHGLMVIDVAERARDGASLEDLAARAEEMRPRAGVCAMLDTLEHLVKGGRVGGARALLGQMLSIKPLLELRDGVVAEAGRQRTRARALNAICDVARSHEPLEASRRRARRRPRPRAIPRHGRGHRERSPAGGLGHRSDGGHPRRPGHHRSVLGRALRLDR